MCVTQSWRNETDFVTFCRAENVMHECLIKLKKSFAWQKRQGSRCATWTYFAAWLNSSIFNWKYTTYLLGWCMVGHSVPLENLFGVVIVVVFWTRAPNSCALGSKWEAGNVRPLLLVFWQSVTITIHCSFPFLWFCYFGLLLQYRWLPP